MRRVTRAQRVLAVVALGVFFFLLHQIGAYYYERQEDPSFNVILLFRLRIVDFGLLLLWALSGFALLRRWE